MGRQRPKSQEILDSESKQHDQQDKRKRKKSLLAINQELAFMHQSVDKDDAASEKSLVDRVRGNAYKSDLCASFRIALTHESVFRPHLRYFACIWPLIE